MTVAMPILHPCLPWTPYNDLIAWSSSKQMVNQEKCAEPSAQLSLLWLKLLIKTLHKSKPGQGGVHGQVWRALIASAGSARRIEHPLRRLYRSINPPPRSRQANIKHELQTIDWKSKQSHSLDKYISFGSVFALLIGSSLIPYPAFAQAASTAPGKPEVIPFYNTGRAGNFRSYFLVKWEEPTPKWDEYSLRAGNNLSGGHDYTGSEGRFLHNTYLRSGSGHNYSIQVCGKNDASLSCGSAWSAATTAQGAPATVSASAITTSGATLTVTNLPAQWWYKGAHSGAVCTSVANGTSSTTLTGLDDDTSYTYHVYYRNNCTEDSDKADHWDVQTTFSTLAALAVPKMATPTLSGGTRRISMTWSHPQGVTGLQAYRIRYREKGTTNWTFADAKPDNGEQNFEGQVTSATIPANETFTMKDNTTYQVQIRAGKWSEGYPGWGAWSDTAEATTFINATLAASNVTETTATLTISGTTAAWYYKRVAPTGDTTCHNVSANTTTASLTGLTGGASYTYKAYSDSTCATEITSAATDAEFSTVGLTANNVRQTTATLVIANYTNAWWYKGNQLGATCTKVQAGTTTASLSSLTNSTDYTYTVYDADNNCNAADKIADVDLSTLAPVNLSVDQITETGARLSIANHPDSWYYKRSSPSVGTCTAVTSGQTASLANLTPGQSYTYKVYSDSACTSGKKIGEATFTAIDFAFVSKTNTTVTLRLNHYPLGQQWWYKETALAAVDCTATTQQQITITGLTKNTSYRVEAYRAAGCTTANQIGLVDLKTFPPHAIFADDVMQTTATLRLSNLPSIPWWYQQVTPVPANTSCQSVASGTTTVGISALAPSTSYTYRAHRDACTQNNKIDDVIFYTLPAAPGKPAVTVDSTTAVTLSWIPNSSGGSQISKWQYKKKEGNNAWETTWTNMPGSTATTTSHTVSGLSSSTAYKFKVRANNATTNSGIDGGGAGAASPESDSATTLAISLTASNVEATTATLAISSHTGN